MFNEEEANNLLRAISGASAVEEGRRWLVTVEKESGEVVKGYVAAVLDEHLALNVDEGGPIQGVDVSWEGIQRVTVEPE